MLFYVQRAERLKSAKGVFQQRLYGGCKERITIGNRAAFGPNVLIYDHDHDISSAESIHDSGYKTSPVVIGDDVWIGANTVILRGTVIGRDCVVGAGSVLKGVYPAGSVIVQKRTENIYEKGRVSG